MNLYKECFEGFKTEDFENVIDSGIYIKCEDAAKVANQIIKERGLQVYGFGSDSEFWQTNMDNRYLQYNKGFVVCIEPHKENK